MAKCELKLEFDRPERRYKPGELVRVTLVVQVDKATRCDDLSISHQWRTHGKGNRTSGNEEKVSLFAGDWGAGEMRRYSHEFRAPAGPLSYRGEYLNVDWYVKARADVPWSLDPKAEEDFIIEPSEQPGVLSIGDPALTKRALDEAKRGADPTGCGRTIFALLGGIFTLVGFCVAAVGVLGLTGELEVDSWFLIPFGGAFSFFGLVLLAVGGWRWLATKKLGEVLLRVEPRLLVPGQRVQVTLQAQPSSNARLNAATATFSCREVVVSGSGTNQVTHTHQIFEETRELPLPMTGYGGPSVLDLSAEFDLPDDAPYSFIASDNRLNWQVELHLDIARWPDWKQTCYLFVLPQGAELPDEA